MANGSYNISTGNSYIQGVVEWTSTSNGSDANTSSLRVRVAFRRTNNYTSNGTINTYVQADTKTLSDTNRYVTLDTNWYYVFDQTFTISHNEDGSKICYIRVYGDANFSLGNFDHSTNITLDNIDRKVSITDFSIVESGQTWVRLKWETSGDIDYARVYLNNSSYYTNNPGSVSGTSGLFQFNGSISGSHESPTEANSTLLPGKTYNIKLEVRKANSNIWSSSQILVIKTNNIATISNKSISFTIGNNLVLQFNNYRFNKSFLKLDIQNISGSYETVASVDETIQIDSYTWNLSSISSTLYKKLPTRNSANIRIECGTTINKKTYSNYTYGTISVSNSNPTFSNFELGNTDTGIVNTLGNSTYLPQGHGNMQARIAVEDKAIAKNEAILMKYEATVTNSSDTVVATGKATYSSQAQVNLNFGSFSTIGLHKINIYAVDSRGNKSLTISKTFYVIPYEQPRVNIDLTRLNGYEQETSLYINIRYSKLTVGSSIKNSVQLYYRYYENTASTISERSNVSWHVINLPSGTSYDTNNMQVSYSATPFVDLQDGSNKLWMFEFQIVDRISVLLIQVPVDKGVPIMFIGDDEIVSVNRLPDITREERFQVGGDILVTDPVFGDVGVLDRINTKIHAGESYPSSPMRMDGDVWIKLNPEQTTFSLFVHRDVGNGFSDVNYDLSASNVRINSGLSLSDKIIVMDERMDNMANISEYKISDESVLIASNAREDLDIVFEKEYSSTPFVIATPYTSTGGAVEIAVKNITTTGFTVNMKNNGASAAYFKVCYLVIGK